VVLHELKYVLTCKTRFGSISAEITNPAELEKVYRDLKVLAGHVGRATKKMSKRSSRTSARSSSRKGIRARGGSGETAVILREIQTKLLNTSFFSPGNPKTTGETLEKLEEVSGKRFTSRKVSQALGILRERRDLTRTGARNYYTYSKA
jgi:hypothetical protein